MLKEELCTVNAKLEQMKSDINEEKMKQYVVIEKVKNRMEKSVKDTYLNLKIDKEMQVKNRDLVSRLDTVEMKLRSDTMKDLRWKSIDY